MMPNLGQGGCQAIEDAFVLSETLEACKSTQKLEDALQDFYKKRIVRVSIVQFLSRLASDLIINAFDTPWSPHDDLGKSWKSYLTFFWKVRGVAPFYGNEIQHISYSLLFSTQQPS